MKVLIEHFQCGGMGTIIDCDNRAHSLCPFCKEWKSWYSETKEVTPQELVQLIRSFKYNIKLI